MDTHLSSSKDLKVGGEREIKEPWGADIWLALANGTGKERSESRATTSEAWPVGAKASPDSPSTKQASSRDGDGMEALRERDQQTAVHLHAHSATPASTSACRRSNGRSRCDSTLWSNLPLFMQLPLPGLHLAQQQPAHATLRELRPLAIFNPRCPDRSQLLPINGQYCPLRRGSRTALHAASLHRFWRGYANPPRPTSSSRCMPRRISLPSPSLFLQTTLFQRPFALLVS